MKKLFTLFLGCFVFLNATQLKAEVNEQTATSGDGNYENVVAIGSAETTALLDLIPVRYSYVYKDIEIITDSGTIIIPAPQKSDKDQFGFIPEELKELFPELVSDDVEGINYTGLIPIMIQSIKNLTTKVETLEEYIGVVEAKVANSSLDNNEIEITSTKPSLSQNTLAPADADAQLAYYLPETVGRASIYIYDMQGTQKCVFALKEKGNAALTIKASTLVAGMYLYSLVADGKLIDTKRLVLTK